MRSCRVAVGLPSVCPSRREFYLHGEEILCKLIVYLAPVRFTFTREVTWSSMTSGGSRFPSLDSPSNDDDARRRDCRTAKSALMSLYVRSHREWGTRRRGSPSRPPSPGRGLHEDHREPWAVHEKPPDAVLA